MAYQDSEGAAESRPSVPSRPRPQWIALIKRRAALQRGLREAVEAQGKAMHDSELAKVEVARVQHDLQTARQSVEQLSSQAATSADREQLIVGEARSELDLWKGRVEVAEGNRINLQQAAGAMRQRAEDEAGRVSGELVMSQKQESDAVKDF